MKPEDAAKKLSLHLMQCGALMPLEWVRENGEESELMEAFRLALNALSTEYREYSCSDCGHTWLEDRDASDYPEYCPECGHLLHPQPEDPLTLEELRTVDETPIWIVTKKYGSGWCILKWHGVNKSYTYFSRTGTAEGMTAIPITAKTYGDLWLAYRRSPEED